MDSPTYQLTSDYARASDFMYRVERLNGRVLVHCIAGVSRR